MPNLASSMRETARSMLAPKGWRMLSLVRPFFQFSAFVPLCYFPS
jgi:hypothetical protein